MSDIVERLRSRTSPLTRVRELSPTAALCREAAAEIERLRNVVQSMKEPMKCECGFTVEVCATNLCMRKKVHSAGLTPGSKWPEPAPIRNRIKDTATSHEAKPFMMLSCREAGRCLHNLPGCICEVDPCYDVDLRLSAGNANVREALELAEDVLSRAPFSTGIWPNGMHPQTGIDKIRDAIRSLGEPQPMPVRALDWQETFTDRGDGSSDHTGWEAPSGFGPFYEIDQYFGSDSYVWQVRYDLERIGDFDDPDQAKACAQEHFAERVTSALTRPTCGRDEEAGK